MEQEKQIDDAIIELLEAETRFEGEVYARVCPHRSGQTVVRDAQRGRNVDHITGPPCAECADRRVITDTHTPEWVRVEAADPIPAAIGMTALDLLGSEKTRSASSFISELDALQGIATPGDASGEMARQFVWRELARRWRGVNADMTRLEGFRRLH